MDAPVAIEVTELRKSFRIPERRAASRLARPLGGGGRELEVLRDISFEVRRGEFFGIVGRNGSGKSTLLKLLASIYRADGGRIRMAGRLAPFLELGVGFNNELAALDNVVVNGVMMGLGAAEARARYEEIVDFAGLADYTDLKLKNYSSGMKVRLGFAIMTHVDADVLLIDEVLAVGDVEFQEKCGESFRRMHDQGRTVVLVTHNMAAVSTYCQRAMLLHEGRIAAIGEPDPVTDRYLELNMEALAAGTDNTGRFLSRIGSIIAQPAARVIAARLIGRDGEPAATFDTGASIEVEATIELADEVPDARLYLAIDNARGQSVYVAAESEMGLPIDPSLNRPGRLRLRATVENRLTGGRYVLRCTVLRRTPEGGLEVAGSGRTLPFDVPGDGHGATVALDSHIVLERESRPETVTS